MSKDVYEHLEARVIDHNRIIDYGETAAAIDREMFCNSMVADHYLNVPCPFCGAEPDIFANPDDYMTYVKCPTQYCGNKAVSFAHNKSTALYGWYLHCKNLADVHGIIFPKKEGDYAQKSPWIL